MLSDVNTALLTVTQNVGHYEALEQTDKYIVWAEDGPGSSVWSDNKMKSQTLTGTIDYFTTEEADTNFGSIQKALSNAGISFKLNSIQYEKETGFTHYEWVFEVK